jgi:hypothetical protein
VDRYWKSYTAASAPAVPPTNAGGFPADGVPSAGVLGTVPGAWWYHSITEEIRNAIVALGGTPDWTKVDQLGAMLAAFASGSGARLAAPDGAALVGFIQSGADGADDPAAIPETVQAKLRQGVVSVADYLPTTPVTDHTAAIQAADAAACASGRVLVFPPRQTFYASQLFLSTPQIDFSFCTIKKNATTSQGLINWGNAADKATGIVDGCISNLIADANGQTNVVNLRLYGNHTRPHLRRIALLNSDYYAVSIGGLTSQGDKNDAINGLDIDTIYIESTRGNAALAWAYSMGLEFFPGVTCYDWNIRNVKTRGAIINKIHATIGLKLSGIDFEATANFNPSASGYCEINNCDNVDIDTTCRFHQDVAGTLYYGLKIAGDRITGWGGKANNVRFAGVADGVCVSGVTNVCFGSDAIVNLTLDIAGTSQALAFNGCAPNQIAMLAGATLSLFSMTGAQCGLLRLNQGTLAAFRWTGGAWSMNANNSRFSNVASARIAHVDIALIGTPQSFALQADGTTDLRLTHCTLNGGGTWDRPFYVSNGAALRIISNDLTGLVSSTLTASGSQAIAKAADNMVNEALVP